MSSHSGSTPPLHPQGELQRLFEGRVKVIEFSSLDDDRGSLIPFDFAQIPFAPCRAFIVHGVAPRASRGGHAHSRGQQLLIRLAGEIIVDLSCEGNEARIELLVSNEGLLIGPRVWSRQTYSGPEAKLLVLASEPYDASSYIREKE